MVLYDEVTSGREVCEPGTGHECGIISEPLLFALAMNRLTDGVKHESLQMTGQNVCVNKGEILEVF